MRTTYPGMLLATLFLFLTMACEKADKCPETSSKQLTSLNTVYIGGTINLKALTSELYTYKYTGPNNFVKQFGHTNYSGDVMITDATTAMSGTYTVEERNDAGCLISSGSVDVQVLPVPNPPCTPTNNTGTSTVIGAGDFNFRYVNWGGSGGFYTVEAKEILGGGAPFMRFTFLGNVAPKEGIYKTDPTYFGLQPTTVGIFIQNGPYDFGARPDQDVYVKLVNGKVQITYCGLNFSNPLGSTAVRCSGRLTQP